MDPSEGSKKDEGTGESQKKLPYEPPRILYRQAIEAIAAVCDDPGKPDTIVCSFQGS